MNIRQFRYTDLDALIHIVQVSFAEELIAQGITPENFIGQIRMATRGRMIPFKVLTALAGIKWGMFVAEIDGNVVGFGGYLGRKHMALANLMVDPDYRRRGIGQALLVKRLQHLARRGYPFVTTTILATNEASLGNVRKQNFEVFDRYSVFETSLPFQPEMGHLVGAITSRPIQKSDKTAFEALETQLVSPTLLQIQGPATSNYFLSFGDRMLGRLTSAQRWTRAFERDGNVIGFLSGNTSQNQAKGTLSRPLVSDENLELLPAMLHEAASWLTQLGKTSMQIAVSDERAQLIEGLQNSSWAKTRSWLRLFKRLDG